MVYARLKIAVLRSCNVGKIAILNHSEASMQRCKYADILKGAKMKSKTISHVQGKGSIAHNNRLFTPKNVDPSRTCNNVSYIQKPIAEAYSEIFDKAVSAYNSKQKRSDRMIKMGYYEHLFNRSPCSTVVEAANGQKSFYEDVV